MVAEPYLTWDTSMGDEGYGEAVKEFLKHSTVYQATVQHPTDGNSAFCRFWERKLTRWAAHLGASLVSDFLHSTRPSVKYLE